MYIIANQRRADICIKLGPNVSLHTTIPLTYSRTYIYMCFSLVEKTILCKGDL